MSPYLAARSRDDQVVDLEHVSAVAERGHGHLAQQLHAGLLLVRAAQVDGHHALDRIVVLVAGEERRAGWSCGGERVRKRRR